MPNTSDKDYVFLKDSFVSLMSAAGSCNRFLSSSQIASVDLDLSMNVQKTECKITDRQVCSTKAGRAQLL